MGLVGRWRTATAMVPLIIFENKTEQNSCCNNKETDLLLQRCSGGAIILSADLGLGSVFLLEFGKT